MTKITKIEFKNYRAFYGTYSDTQNTINLPNGENALIYGENGSGKSSVYQGLKDFFNAANNTTVLENSPKHLKALNPADYEVKISFDDQPEVSFINGSYAVPFSSYTFKLNSFLSYKELLRTHLLDNDADFESQFFKLVIGTLLKDREYGTSTITLELKDITSINEEISTIDNRIPTDTDRDKLIKQIDEDDDENDNAEIKIIKENLMELKLKEKELEEKLQKLNDHWRNELVSIQGITQQILNTFAQGIEIEFDISTNIALLDNKIIGSLGLKVKYIDVELSALPNTSHLEILNEARLSALAISIFLASIITNPINTTDTYKILFLDDIFIGLDMSNRLPLLNILKDKFYDYQIFMTTYDKAWFEVAKKHLPEWQTIQMYVGKNEQENFEYPLIISPSLNYYQQAKIYANRNQDSKYKDKYLDYAAEITYVKKSKLFLKSTFLVKIVSKMMEKQ